MVLKKCVKCGTNFENGGFKTLCPKCYAETNGKREQEIRRLCFVKAASQQQTNRTPSELIKYSKELEAHFLKWNEEV